VEKIILIHVQIILWDFGKFLLTEMDFSFFFFI
jgi:hypothetical protein